MSPRREDREFAQRLLDADPALLRQVADMLEARQADRTSQDQQIEATEPANRRIAKFSGRFEPGGKVYSFAAIRADNWREDGRRRWFVTQNTDLGKPPVLHSPCTWVELVRFAVPGSVSVAPSIAHWRPVSNLPVLPDVGPDTTADPYISGRFEFYS